MKISTGIILPCLLALTIFSGCTNRDQATKTDPLTNTEKFKHYSKAVKDTFYISLQLPLNYKKESKKRYQVVVLTDANFYFPMLGAVLHQY